MAIAAEPAAVGIATGRWSKLSSSFASPTMYWPADTPLIGPVST